MYMVSELTPAPISTSATPFSFSASVRTALAVAVGVKIFFAGATFALLSIRSMLLTALLLPMKNFEIAFNGLGSDTDNVVFVGAYQFVVC